MVCSSLLVVKNSWKQIVYKKQVYFISHKNISSLKYLTLINLPLRIIRQWSLLGEQREMASTKVLVFLVGMMLLFMACDKASAASLFEEDDGMTSNTRTNLKFIQEISSHL